MSAGGLSTPHPSAHKEHWGSMSDDAGRGTHDDPFCPYGSRPSRLSFRTFFLFLTYLYDVTINRPDDEKWMRSLWTVGITLRPLPSLV